METVNNSQLEQSKQVAPVGSTLPPQTQTWSVPEGSQPQDFPWKVVNLIIGGVAGLAILLLVVWFLLTKFSLSSGSVKTWNGITPGTTTKTEVINKLGQPLEEKTESLGQMLTYDSGIKALPNTIIYNPTTGKVTGTLVSVSDQTQAQKYYQEMLKLGKPEKVMYSTYLQFSKIYIFAQKGISYSANEQSKAVDAIHYFQPTTLEKYLAQFGQFFSEKNPYKF